MATPPKKLLTVVSVSKGSISLFHFWYVRAAAPWASHASLSVVCSLRLKTAKMALKVAA